MSPFGYLVLGCALGALGFGGALALLFVQERMVRRETKQWHDDMEGR